MIRLGLTGGVGMGKSTVGTLFQNLGVPVVDTDVIARQIVELGQPSLTEIVAAFGPSILLPDGRLDRSALARVVFSDAKRREALESILHPRIAMQWREEVGRWRERQVPAGVVIIPLLHETDSAPFFEHVVCVGCSVESQFVRLQKRGWSESDIEARIAAQWSAVKKADVSDFLIWTDVSLDLVGHQVRRILGVVLAKGQVEHH